MDSKAATLGRHRGFYYPAIEDETMHKVADFSYSLVTGAPLGGANRPFSSDRREIRSSGSRLLLAG
jgi:hypothetical protein